MVSICLIVILLRLCIMRKQWTIHSIFTDWRRFRDDVNTLWIHSDEDANNYLDYLNTIDDA